MLAQQPSPCDPTDRTVHLLDSKGYIRDWLKSPAWGSPAEDLDVLLEADGDPWGEGGRWVLTNGPDASGFKEQLAKQHPIDTTQNLPKVVEGGPIVWRCQEQEVSGVWMRDHTRDDGYVDWSQFCFTPEYRSSVAATCIEVDQAEWRDIDIEVTGPVAVWLNGELILNEQVVSYMEPVHHRLRYRLPSGTSTLLVALWNVAFRECRQILRVRILGLPVRIVIPSPGSDEWLSCAAENLLDAVGSISWALGGGNNTTLKLIGPARLGVRIRCNSGAWARKTFDHNGTLDLNLSGLSGKSDDDSSATMLRTGEIFVDLEIDDTQIPLRRSLRVANLPDDSRTEVYGSPQVWRKEMLEFAASATPQTARALARCVLDPTNARATPEELDGALHRITTRGDCADFEILGLLHLLHRLPESRWDSALRKRVNEALTDMKYWIEQPGLDAMCYFTENHQFVWHVAQRISGLTFGDRTFTNDGRSGVEHAEEGRERVAAWIERKLSGGFSEFDSNAYLAINTLSLVTLVEFDTDDRVRNAAEALLDVMLLTLCANSWQGVHGAPHGRTYVQTLRSARLEETSPLLRVIAGIGTLNAALLPATVLATAERYRIPSIHREVATNIPAEWWATQTFRGNYAFERDLLSRPFGSDVRIWRTPDGMLSSVQDYRQGLPGLQEHIGGAVVGREMQVFVTYPANCNTDSSARPNAWAGQRILPRVRQHRNVMLSFFRFPTDAPDAAAHLWMPLSQSDEWKQWGSWLAVRVGSGYVAVATRGGVCAVTTGENAQQEFVPREGFAGEQWVTVLGRAAEQAGTTKKEGFAAFCAGLEEPDFGEELRYRSPDGTVLNFGWNTPFLVDGCCPDLGESGVPVRTPRLVNPAVTLNWGDDHLEAEWNGARLIIDLAEQRRIYAD
ncbi:MAG: hypothetical protein B5766_00800 [Candidatus Lumbricidophila eiseniae]|uniref:Uncharacterized protein n=1 Tax=Candidatus Lumbricidiphila eiseniae TaxID=1969409 RepID=A0A2A6FUW4_9MICO|nr:MAG: hypothetical protein B5766_00800 [Candidatus Lumbricidophila eiseniae]